MDRAAADLVRMAKGKEGVFVGWRFKFNEQTTTSEPRGCGIFLTKQLTAKAGEKVELK